MSEAPKTILTDMPIAVPVPNVTTAAVPVVLDRRTQFYAMIAALAINVGIIAQLVMQARSDARNEARARENAQKVSQVKETLEVVDARQNRKIDKVLHVSNSVLGRSLLLNRNYAADRAARTKTPEDIAEAADQQRLYDEHMQDQVAADRSAKLPDRIIEPQKP